MFELRITDTIDEIGKEILNSLSDDGFFTHEWFKTLETSKPFKIIPQYLIVREENTTEAIAPCFFQYESQYLTLEDLNPLMKKLKVKSFLSYSLQPSLTCYSPCSFHSSILFEKGRKTKEILDLMSKGIDDICEKHRILFSSFFYVSEFDTFLMQHLPDFGYFRIPLFHTLYMDIKWSNFDEYLASLDFKVRKNIRREIRKNRSSGVIIEKTSDFRSLSRILSDLYSNLFLKHRGERSSLQHLFFERLNQYAKEKVWLFIAKKDGKIVGFSLCLAHRNNLDVWMTGFDYSHQTKTDFTYFNLAYYTPIRVAIKEGIRRIHFRQGTEDVKLRRGCKMERIYLFVKCHSKLLSPIVEYYIKLWALKRNKDLEQKFRYFSK